MPAPRSGLEQISLRRVLADSVNGATLVGKKPLFAATTFVAAVVFASALALHAAASPPNHANRLKATFTALQRPAVRADA